MNRLNELVGMFDHGALAGLALMVQIQALSRRLAGVVALPWLNRFPHQGVPRLWGVAAGTLLFLALAVGITAGAGVQLGALGILAVASEIPFLFARVNVARLFRRRKGEIRSGEDWRTARRGESWAFAALGVAIAVFIWPLARLLAAASVVGLGLGLALIALSGVREAGRGPLRALFATGPRRVLLASCVVAVAVGYLAWPVPEGVLESDAALTLATSLGGAAACGALALIVSPRARDLRRALADGTRHMSAEVGRGAVAPLVASLAGALVSEAARRGGLGGSAVALAGLAIAAVLVGALRRRRTALHARRPDHAHAPRR